MHRCRDGEVFLSLLPLARVELAEAEVAVPIGVRISWEYGNRTGGPGVRLLSQPAVSGAAV